MTICVPNEYTKINKRLDNLFANQRMTYKYHLLSLLAHMRNSRTLAIMQEEYEIANSIQKNIEKIEKLKDSFKPISSGAYKIKKFSEKELILVKNENYWDKDNVQIPQINLFLDLSKEEAIEKFNIG